MCKSSAKGGQLRAFLAQRFGIRGELEDWVKMMSTDADRASQVELGSNSKLKSTRTFHGFLVKACTPIHTVLRKKAFTIYTPPGTAMFVEDYRNMVISRDVLIVGIENGENFMRAEQTLNLFPNKEILFVSRYPQSSDIRVWLQSIDNQYIHFGDFDLAGINIYLGEFYSYLGERASFFVPDNIEELLSRGNAELYDKQYQRYKNMEISDLRVSPLVAAIHKYRKVFEQEGLLKSGSTSVGRNSP